MDILLPRNKDREGARGSIAVIIRDFAHNFFTPNHLKAQVVSRFLQIFIKIISSININLYQVA